METWPGLTHVYERMVFLIPIIGKWLLSEEHFFTHHLHSPHCIVLCALCKISPREVEQEQCAIIGSRRSYENR